MDHRCTFAIRLESVRDSRRFVKRELADTCVDLWAAELLTSELATNAVAHAQTDFEVRVTARPHGVRVEVTNDAPEMLAAIRQADHRGGRGLRIVEALASAWGTTQDRSNKTVWFELASSDQGAEITRVAPLHAPERDQPAHDESVSDSEGMFSS